MTYLFVWTWAAIWPPALIGLVLGGLLVLGIRMIITSGAPGPSGITLTLSGPDTVQNGSYSSPFTLTVTSNDPNVPVAGRQIVFTVTALNPPPGTPYDFCRIIKATDSSGVLHGLPSGVSIYRLSTTSSGTADVVVQPDGVGTVTMIANDVKANETVHYNFESIP